MSAKAMAAPAFSQGGKALNAFSRRASLTLKKVGFSACPRIPECRLGSSYCSASASSGRRSFPSRFCSAAIWAS
jgi:hypothetical protein